MKTKGILIVGILVVMGIFGFLLYKGIEKSATYYYTVAELHETELAGKQVRVKGALLKDTVVYEPEVPRLKFTVTDDGENRLQMVLLDVMPDNFDHVSEVIAEGTMNGEQFAVTKLMLQCPSKYENEESKGGE